MSAAVAGEDLVTVARAASQALGVPVAVAAPAQGDLTVWPPSDAQVENLRPLADAAGAAVSALLREQNQALHESELLLELASDGAPVTGQEETFRLLIGVLLRDRDELERLRAGTVAPLAVYDAEHDTDLLATLETFLAHHGSTTDTAEALGLHRHTVGYRLARAHEVSGLSPHESDGRERLGLGLKAHQILEAERRLAGERE